MRHSIPEESTSATEASLPRLASSSKLTVERLNDQVSAPISDATLRRRSLAIEAGRSLANDPRRPSFPRSYSACDITSPFDHNIDTSIPNTATSPTCSPLVDDEDDIDSNTLFHTLAEDPLLSHDWSLASLALIPLARTLTTQHAADLVDPHFVALHAFAPSKLYKDQFVSVRSMAPPTSAQDMESTSLDCYHWNQVTLTATIETDQKTVSIIETFTAPPSSSSSDPASTSAPDGFVVGDDPATIARRVKIISETTIYRTPPKASTPSPSDRSESREQGQPIPSKDGPAFSEKVRVVSVDLPIVYRRVQGAGAPYSHNNPAADTSQSSDSTNDGSDVSASDLILGQIPPKRLFAVDLATLADPRQVEPRLANALSSAFDVLFSAAHQFIASFVYVKGFDSYNAHRIRRGIWFKAWKAFEERLGSEHIARLSVDAFHRIKSLLENVVMGLVHTKMYGPIQDQLLEADLSTDEVLAAYYAFNVSLADFGVQSAALRQRPHMLADAITTLSHGLCDDGGPDIDEALTTGNVALLNDTVRGITSGGPLTAGPEPSHRIQTDLGILPPSGKSSSMNVARSGLHRRTPLQVLQSLRAAIDEIGWAAERVHQSSSRAPSSVQERAPPLGTDDLLPILSYIFVRARPSRLCSMLYYARTFQLTDTATSPELQWALVTCDAVIAYLRTDPLRLCHRRSSSSFLVEPLRKSSHSQSGSGGSNDIHPARSLSSRSHQGSAAAVSLQASTVMARSHSGHESASATEATPPHSPRSPFLPIDAASDHLSTSGSNSYFQRHGDVSTEHSAYPASEASPRLQGEGFKLPGLPASISSRRNSRILQPRPASVFSLSEDGDAVSLAQDTSLDTLERRLSTAASQSPSRPLGTRDRTFSSSSSSATHNDVQIRPQIVRTIKRSQAGSLYSSNRLERTSSNGSTASSSHVHVRVVGSPSMRAIDTSSGRESPLSNASPPKSERRRSVDTWTAFSLFPSFAPHSGTVPVGQADDRTFRHRHRADNVTDACTTSFGLSERATPSGWLSWGAEAVGGSRRNSVSTTNSRANSGIDSRIAHATTNVKPESDDTNCQPEGVEALGAAAMQRPLPSHSTLSDVASLQFPASQTHKTETGLTASVPSLAGTGRSERRYRGRFLSTSSATLAGSAAPLPPQVDRSSMSAADVVRPRPTQRQSIGSLNALRATMNRDSGAVLDTVTSSRSALTGPGMEVGSEESPEMIPYGGDVAQQMEPPARQAAMPESLAPLFLQLHLPSPVAEAGCPTLPGSSASELDP